MTCYHKALHVQTMPTFHEWRGLKEVPGLAS